MMYKKKRAKAEMFRPSIIEKNMDINNFDQHYWLVTEMKSFCRKHGVAIHGVKSDLHKRIMIFLSKEIIDSSKPIRNKWRDSDKIITKNTPVINYKNDLKTRNFFEQNIGPHFRFNVAIQNYIRDQQTKEIPITYGDLITEWLADQVRRKDPSYQIQTSPSCEYNRFVQDYSRYSKKLGKSVTRKEILNAWNEIKKIPGPKLFSKWKNLLG